MTYPPTWQCLQCNTNNTAGTTACRLCTAPGGLVQRRGPQHQARPEPVTAAVHPPVTPSFGTAALAPPPPAAPTGAAAPPRRRGRGAVIGVVVGVVGLVVGFGVVEAAKSTSSSSAGTTTASADPSTSDGFTGGSSDTMSTTTTPAPSASQLLRRQIAADQQAVDQLEGEWVPQISSKRPGMVLNGKRLGLSDVYRTYVSWHDSYPGALLLWSGDYGSFAVHDFYVVIVNDGFPDAASANQWCDTEGIGANDCFARRISRSAGSGPNAVHRA